MLHHTERQGPKTCFEASSSSGGIKRTAHSLLKAPSTQVRVAGGNHAPGMDAPIPLSSQCDLHCAPLHAQPNKLHLTGKTGLSFKH